MKLNLSKTRLTVPDYNSLLYFKLCILCKWEHFKITLVSLHKRGIGLYLPRNGDKLVVLILLQSDGGPVIYPRLRLVGRSSLCEQ